MVKKRLVAIVMSLAMISVGNFSYAHSGGHNSSGSHHNKNKSELTYYYYCGGHSAHQHNKGFCPYASAKSNSGVTISSAHNEKNHKKFFSEKEYNKGYEDGCKGLYNLSFTEAKSEDSYEKGYLIGYNEYKAKKVYDVIKKMLDIPMLASI
ncbi:hypothetical protein [Clostridioides difficile]|uniref:YHYH domain-containing protein n=2 Tax=Clostridioides difficile TaxID=1496 RepID=A0AAX3GU31_CLODI|nr:hypothetical protein [Clostridioides difficile]AVD34704.1 hypothetical protein C4E42_02080 [Clostridioides difficile]AVD38442.1 hypothetical protein C4E26_03355 [Clostridioides difficile]AVD41969.1 hypothetical protein C4E25_03360 [Clostridioides difficile]AXU68514.1 hypothetical protein CDIF29020_02229 [Clostridioides difficile]AXU90646.1 hypothetical protein CDIF29747_02145 [Clostridioides difficile]